MQRTDLIILHTPLLPNEPRSLGRNDEAMGEVRYAMQPVTARIVGQLEVRSSRAEATNHLRFFVL